LPSGEYEVYARDGINPRQTVEQRAKTIRVGNSEKVAVELRLPSRDGAITGRVVDERGAPVEDAWVSALPGDLSADPFGQIAALSVSRESRRALSDHDGRFEITGLNRDALFDLETEHGLGGRTVVKGVRAGAQVNLTLRAYGKLTGTALDEADKPVRQFALVIENAEARQTLYQQVAMREAQWSVGHVAPGALSLSAIDPEGRRALVTTTLSAGQVPTPVALRFVREGPPAALAQAGSGAGTPSVGPTQAGASTAPSEPRAPSETRNTAPIPGSAPPAQN
jgi:hypothetical protein